jgi:hypothetical protein
MIRKHPTNTANLVSAAKIQFVVAIQYHLISCLPKSFTKYYAKYYAI